MNYLLFSHFKPNRAVLAPKIHEAYPFGRFQVD